MRTVSSLRVWNEAIVERLGRVPRHRRALRRGLRFCVAIILRAWLRAYHRFTVTGAHHLPAAGPFVLVANHASHLDTLCLLAALPLRRLPSAYAAAAADYFFVGAGAAAAAVLLCNALPFQRRAHLRQSLDLCRRLLCDGSTSILVLYPEGTRSSDGRLGRFRPGIGALLAGTRVPVVPCHLHGAGRALGKGKWLPRPRRIRLSIGAPRRYAASSRDRAAAAAIAHDLEQAVNELSQALNGKDV
jgi:1-acyl-sn-glycerol-3-phosphate acyltransferase